jgi:uncharacterized membrane protein
MISISRFHLLLIPLGITSIVIGFIPLTFKFLPTTETNSKITNISDTLGKDRKYNYTVRYRYNANGILYDDFVILKEKPKQLDSFPIIYLNNFPFYSSVPNHNIFIGIMLTVIGFTLASTGVIIYFIRKHWNSIPDDKS